MTPTRWTLPGSNVIVPKTFHIHSIGPINPAELLTSTIFLRTGTPLPDVMELYNIPLQERQYLSRAEFMQKYSMSSADLQLMEKFAAQFGLKLVSSDPVSCSVVMQGTVAEWNEACGIKWTVLKGANCAELPAYRGDMSLPDYLEDVVVAFTSHKFGNGATVGKKPNKHVVVSAEETAAEPTGYWATDIAKMYNFPEGKHGAGQTVAIWEYEAAYSVKDLEAYFEAGKVKKPSIKTVAMDGYVPPQIASEAGAPYEETNLDIQVAGAIANEADFLVYMFPYTTSYATGIYQILFDTDNTIDVLSISYGLCELLIPEGEMKVSSRAMQTAALLGVSITVSSGDGGSPTKEANAVGREFATVNFPAASPYVLACGGIHTDTEKGSITNESVWNQLNQCLWSSAGGRSVVFPVPEYQKNVDLPPNANFVKVPLEGRAVPDVASNAAQRTGFYVYLNEKRVTIGGTSAAAPLWAALIAIMNSALGHNLGLLHPKIYQLQRSDAFVSITTGNNGAYSAMNQYDCCTGLGRPNGEALLEQMGE